MSVKVDIRKLFETGAHFGHKTSRWHPKMAPYIHSKRGGIHIINLEETVESLEKALNFITEVVGQGKQLLYVGTKRQAKDIVKKSAIEAKMPYVTVRWLGGMLTNSKTIGERVKHLKKLEERMESGELANRYSKLEVQRFQEEIDSLNVSFGGIKHMSGKPGVVFVTDALTDGIAIKEAHRLGVPVVAIVDTNANPSGIEYPVPANDDAIKSLELLCDYVKQAVEAGQTAHANASKKTAEAAAKAKPAPKTAKKEDK